MTLSHLDTLIAYTAVMLGVSLIVTVLTQVVSAFLGLRGTNLLWGTKTLLKSIDPELEQHAEAILSHPLISDSLLSRFHGPLRRLPVLGRLARRWTLASAIRPAEIAAMLAAHAGELRVAASALAIPDDAALRRIGALEQASQLAVGQAAERFDSAMDRVSQRFASQMRIWTVMFSFAIALAVPLDTFHLFERLWSDPQARDSMLETRTAMLREAEAVAGSSEHAAVPGAEPEVYALAFERLQKQHPDRAFTSIRIPVVTSYDAARKWVAAQLVRSPLPSAGAGAARGAGVPGTTQSSGTPQGIAPNPDTEGILQDYAKLVESALAERANVIRGQIETSGLDLLPRPFRVFHFSGRRNLLGALVSAVLLSLGAPFWFNALKSLTNLRPVLANKQDRGA